jgi:alpha-beta hydrolase superfamily lysophospholipase
MTAIKIPDAIDHHRRRLFGAAAMTLVATQLGKIGSAAAQSGETKPTGSPAAERQTNTSFAPLKQIDAGLLNVEYAEAGPSDGPAVILLHGWPYDIHSYVDVVPFLASAGHRVIVPHLRGYPAASRGIRARGEALPPLGEYMSFDRRASRRRALRRARRSPGKRRPPSLPGRGHDRPDRPRAGAA